VKFGPIPAPPLPAAPAGFSPITAPSVLMSFRNGSGRNVFDTSCGSNRVWLVFTLTAKSMPIRSNQVSDSEMIRTSTATARSWSRLSASSRSAISRITSDV